MIFGNLIKNWDPSKEGVWELWEYGSCIFLLLPRSIERCPSWSQEAKGEEGEETESNGDDGLSDDVSLILILVLVLVTLGVRHSPSRCHCGVIAQGLKALGGYLGVGSIVVGCMSFYAVCKLSGPLPREGTLVDQLV